MDDSSHLPVSPQWLVCASTPLLRPMSLLELLPAFQLLAPALGACCVLQAPLRSRVLLSPHLTPAWQPDLSLRGQTSLTSVACLDFPVLTLDGGKEWEEKCAPDFLEGKW